MCIVLKREVMDPLNFPQSLFHTLIRTIVLYLPLYSLKEPPLINVWPVCGCNNEVQLFNMKVNGSVHVCAVRELYSFLTEEHFRAHQAKLSILAKEAWCYNVPLMNVNIAS